MCSCVMPPQMIFLHYFSYLKLKALGDVARAMGDAESTVKRFYVRTLEPGVGKDWFNLREKVCPGT